MKRTTVFAFLILAGCSNNTGERKVAPESLASKLPDSVVLVKEFAPVEVNFDRPLEEMLKAGKYGYCLDNIFTEKNFPAASEPAAKGKKTLTFFIFKAVGSEGTFVKRDEIIDKMKECGSRPVTAREIMAFGELLPEVQKDFVIFALESRKYFIEQKRNMCPILCFLPEPDSKRALMMGVCGSRDGAEIHRPGAHFLAVKE